jgi:hypothetical protein
MRQKVLGSIVRPRARSFSGTVPRTVRSVADKPHDSWNLYEGRMLSATG